MNLDNGILTALDDALYAAFPGDALARVVCLDGALAGTLDDGALRPFLDGAVAPCLYDALSAILMAETSSSSSRAGISCQTVVLDRLLLTDSMMGVMQGCIAGNDEHVKEVTAQTPNTTAPKNMHTNISLLSEP